MIECSHLPALWAQFQGNGGYTVEERPWIKVLRGVRRLMNGWKEE